MGSVAVILGASGGKLDDVIPEFQSTVEFAEIISRGWHRLGYVAGLKMAVKKTSRNRDIILSRKKAAT